MASPCAPVQEDQGASSRLPPRGLHAFARVMADNVLRSALIPLSPGGVGAGQLAGELASTVLAAALTEASALLKDTAAEEMQMDEDNVIAADLQGPGPFRPPPLPQSGLPAAGSLDYPDAPPSTPLLPELERSRDGFSRRLKGGLAREFLPAPPPPTPTPGGAVLLAEETEPCPGGAKMAAYAEELSREIVCWAAVQYAHTGEQSDDDEGLLRLAGQLAHLVVTTAMKEVP